jgi:hypothetical protein
MQMLQVLQPLLHAQPLDDQRNYTDIALLLCDEARRSVRPTTCTAFFYFELADQTFDVNGSALGACLYLVAVLAYTQQGFKGAIVELHLHSC